MIRTGNRWSRAKSLAGERPDRIYPADMSSRVPSPRLRLYRALSLTSALALLVSCQAPARFVTAPPGGPPPGSGLPVLERKITVTPAKVRPGAKTIQYSLIEVTVPEKGAAPAFLAPHPGNPGSPRFVAFDSLRELSQTKGVDLMNVGTGKEGQTVHTKILSRTKWPTEFSPSGQPLDYMEKSTGVDTSFRGALTKNGKAIAVRCSLDVSELAGLDKYKLPSGAEVVQPRFQSTALREKNLQIPDGGFVLMRQPVGTRVQYIEDHSFGGLVRKKSTMNLMRYMGISATSSSGRNPGPAVQQIASR